MTDEFTKINNLWGYDVPQYIQVFILIFTFDARCEYSGKTRNSVTIQRWLLDVECLPHHNVGLVSKVDASTLLPRRDTRIHTAAWQTKKKSK